MYAFSTNYLQFLSKLCAVEKSNKKISSKLHYVCWNTYFWKEKCKNRL